MAKLLRRSPGSASSLSSGSHLGAWDNGNGCNGDACAAQISSTNAACLDSTDLDDFAEAAEVCIRLFVRAHKTCMDLRSLGWSGQSAAIWMAAKPLFITV